MKEEVKVTNSEWYVMNCLWEKRPLSLMQLVPLLKESAGWSKSTSATMVRRMTEKELIGYEENGKTKYFFPKVDKQDVVVQETRDFLQRIYDGSVGMMMSALVRQKKRHRKSRRKRSNVSGKDKAREWQNLGYGCWSHLFLY